jgi:hypothetical protein
MVLHLNQPEIQFIGLLEFVSDEYLCCCNRSHVHYSRHFSFSTDVLSVTFFIYS